MGDNKATKKFAADARHAMSLLGLTNLQLAVELGCHRNSVSRAINYGTRVCPRTHRDLAKRLKLKPLI